MNADLLYENSAVRHTDPYLTPKEATEMARCYAWIGCLNLQYGFLPCSFLGGNCMHVFYPHMGHIHHFLNFITPIIFGEVHRPSSS
jgi:hypothetical protein